MPLNNLRLQALQKSAIPGKYTDDQGLYLRITSAGGMYWQWRIRTPKETIVSYGVFPEVGLAEARERHRMAREQRRHGVDPNTAKRQVKLTRHISMANTFEALALEWFATRKGEWAPKHADKVISRLKRDVFPRIGKLPIAEITALHLLDTARKIEARGVHETARRAVDTVSQVYRYAIVTGRAAINPAANLRQVLKAPPPVKHMPAITDPSRLGELLRALEGYRGSYVVRAALKLAPMLLLRPGELRQGRWDEFDLEKATWTVPAARMKRKQAGKVSGSPHVVPLPRQAVEILRDLHDVSGPAGYVFHGERDRSRPMSENTVNAALRSMGFDTSTEMTGHGFRATARTLLVERLGIEESVIEAQLAHRVPDALGRAYNRTQFCDDRRTMMQTWADYLEQLRVIKIPTDPPAKVRQDGWPSAANQLVPGTVLSV